jgi:L-alanine-DL-glutamate epimerase-like enolase superfamily enzyme
MPPMSIKDLRVTLLRAPFTDPPRWSKSYDRPRELVVVELEDAQGRVGLGYLMLLQGGLLTVKTCLEELVRPRVIGRRANEVEAIWHDLWSAMYGIGRMGVAVFALSAVDVALWDLAGKQAGLPLHRLWGSCKTRIPAYGSGCWRGLGRDGMIDKAKRYVARGLGAIKMQMGHIYDRHTDVGNVLAMRQALGPKVEIMIDVNMNWTADEAIQRGGGIIEADPYWLEEPVPAEDFDGYLRIARALPYRIVGGENHYTRHDLKPLLAAPEIPILQPDPMRGGLTELRKIAVAAEMHGKTIAPHLFHELTVQLMAAIPNGNYLEYVDFLDDLWVEPVLPDNGVITVPERPGHGLAFKPEVLKSCKVAA